MRIYVAGSSHEIPLVRGWMDRLRQKGHIITHDWTVEVDRFGGPRPNDGSLDMTVARNAANEDLNGIDSADMFWLITPAEGSRGAFVELGYAISLIKSGEVWGCSSGPFVSIFQARIKRFATREEAFAEITK